MIFAILMCQWIFPLIFSWNFDWLEKLYRLELNTIYAMWFFVRIFIAWIPRCAANMYLIKEMASGAHNYHRHQIKLEPKQYTTHIYNWTDRFAVHHPIVHGISFDSTIKWIWIVYSGVYVCLVDQPTTWCSK